MTIMIDGILMNATTLAANLPSCTPLGGEEAGCEESSETPSEVKVDSYESGIGDSARVYFIDAAARDSYDAVNHGLRKPRTPWSNICLSLADRRAVEAPTAESVRSFYQTERLSPLHISGARIAAIRNIVAADARDVVDPLIALLSNKDPTVVWVCLSALSNYRNVDKAAEALSHMLTNTALSVYWQMDLESLVTITGAIGALAGIGSDAAIETLEKLAREMRFFQRHITGKTPEVDLALPLTKGSLSIAASSKKFSQEHKKETAEETAASVFATLTNGDGLHSLYRRLDNNWSDLTSKAHGALKYALVSAACVNAIAAIGSDSAWASLRRLFGDMDDASIRERISNTSMMLEKILFSV